MKPLKLLLFAATLIIAMPNPWARAQIFYTSNRTDSIETASLDGSSSYTLIDFDTILLDDSYTPRGILIADGRLIWADADHFNGEDLLGQAAIYVAGLDGSNPRRLIEMDVAFGNGSYDLYGIAAGDNQLFWTDIRAGRNLHRRTRRQQSPAFD